MYRGLAGGGEAGLVLEGPAADAWETADVDLDAFARGERSSAVGGEDVAHARGHAAVGDARDARGLGHGVEFEEVLGHERDVAVGLAGLDDRAKGAEADAARVVPTVLEIATHPEAAREKVAAARRFVEQRQRETMERLATCLSDTIR